MTNFIRFILFILIIISVIAINYKQSEVYYIKTPTELRDKSVYRWLSGSFRIENRFSTGGNTFGSGTLCHYDRKTNTGYIITCGHLFKSYEDKTFIDVCYKNKIKLSTPTRFKVEIIDYNELEDIAFLKFKPDWVPNECFPIASLNTKINVNDYLWSPGCDMGCEVAIYKVKVILVSDLFLFTKENSPRYGRSGGGLITNDGLCVGICVRSTDPMNGNGLGSFVSLSRIHLYCEDIGLTELLNIPKQ